MISVKMVIFLLDSLCPCKNWSFFVKCGGAWYISLAKSSFVYDSSCVCAFLSLFACIETSRSTCYIWAVGKHNQGMLWLWACSAGSRLRVIKLATPATFACYLLMGKRKARAVLSCGIEPPSDAEAALPKAEAKCGLAGSKVH